MTSQTGGSTVLLSAWCIMFSQREGPGRPVSKRRRTTKQKWMDLTLGEGAVTKDVKWLKTWRFSFEGPHHPTISHNIKPLTDEANDSSLREPWFLVFMWSKVFDLWNKVAPSPSMPVALQRSSFFRHFPRSSARFGRGAFLRRGGHLKVFVMSPELFLSRWLVSISHHMKTGSRVSQQNTTLAKWSKLFISIASGFLVRLVGFWHKWIHLVVRSHFIQSEYCYYLLCSQCFKYVIMSTNSLFSL